MTEKEQLFEAVQLIVHDELRSWVQGHLIAQPEKFWTVPASSSGKHHPEQSNGEGGLVRHILATIYFAREWFCCYSATQDEKDCVIAALILHDIGEVMNEPHDIVGAQALRWKTTEDPMILAAIAGVRWHMGPWATGSTLCHPAERGTACFPEDFSRINQMVHLSDYAASRKRVNLTKLEI